MLVDYLFMEYLSVPISVFLVVLFVVMFYFDLKYKANIVKLLHYLKNKYPEKWKEVVGPIFTETLPGAIFAGFIFMSQEKKIKEFLKEQDNLNDNELTELKSKTLYYFTWDMRLIKAFIATIGIIIVGVIIFAIFEGVILSVIS